MKDHQCPEGKREPKAEPLRPVPVNEIPAMLFRTSTAGPRASPAARTSPCLRALCPHLSLLNTSTASLSDASETTVHGTGWSSILKARSSCESAGSTRLASHPADSRSPSSVSFRSSIIRPVEQSRKRNERGVSIRHAACYRPLPRVRYEQSGVPDMLAVRPCEVEVTTKLGTSFVFPSKQCVGRFQTGQSLLAIDQVARKHWGDRSVADRFWLRIARSPWLGRHK